jgi:hypothetical protein
MTQRTKIKLMSSVLLALLVILSAIAFAISSTPQNAANSASALLIAIIILASISSVFVVYFTKVQKRKYEKLLNQEYFQEYEILKDAVANSQLAISNKKEVNEDILDILLSAQQVGKSIHEVVGNMAWRDPAKLFCYPAGYRHGRFLYSGCICFAPNNSKADLNKEPLGVLAAHSNWYSLCAVG